ncbi:hypothetical protein [Nocardia caishijiensis]|uniref:Uncharacterized protein n=1 Tax=Nocardia caishijiensis TaxID=184756 RepID=A0ABQ6YQ78_9NOCA|nr:hypothetical protein [Nocardia caishijiensis]KAF0847803.1 hypothetical protein FNL39_103705 [Nocardia caishijiensis]
MHFHDGKPYFQHNAVIGGGYVTCSTRPEVFHISLTVQHRARGGSWQVRGAEASDQTPDPRLNIATYAPCQPGAWRVVATISDNHAIGSYSDSSTEAIISC